MELESRGSDDGPGGGLEALPAKESISPFLRNLLNESFNTVDDLSGTPSLVARLLAELDEEKENFRKAQAQVLVTTSRGLSRFGLLTNSLEKLTSKIENVRASSVPLSSMQREGSGSGGNGTAVSEKKHGISNWEEKEKVEIERIMNPGRGETESEGTELNRRGMVEELENLANEVARVEKVRIYAESALKLEQLVGDLEAAVATISSSVRSSTQSGGILLKATRAVKIMQTTEAAVAEISNAHWNRLVSAVDLRVDRVAAILRPVVVADHRHILKSIGWPPPLSASSVGGNKLVNPLLEMSEVQERTYFESFMALTILQAVQQARRERQLNQYKNVNDVISPDTLSERKMKSRANRAPLWAMDELVSPVAAKAEPHFLRWTTKPELAFALAFRLAQEYVDSVDEILQPLIDKANLAGYSAREEWVFSLSSMMSLYLQNHILPGLANDLQDDGGAGSVAAALWLHIVDEALAFDGRMKSLAMRVLGLFQGGSLEEAQVEDLDNLSGPVVLSISAIADRQEWLEMWATLEREDVLAKLKVELHNDGAWVTKTKADVFLGLVQDGHEGANGFLGAPIENFRAPAGASLVMASMSAITDRCRSLLEPYQQYVFVKLGAIPIAQVYLQEMLGPRCLELQAVTALADEESMVKVATCLNAARFCQHSLQEWGEDIFFVELLNAHQDETQGTIELTGGSIFDQEIGEFEQFRKDWLNKLVSSISRGFEARCREYLWNKKRWSDPGNGTQSLAVPVQDSDVESKPRPKDLMDETYVNTLKDFDVSATMVDSLAVLQSQLSTLNATLDFVNFLELWRSLAAVLDQLLVNSVVLSGAKFSDYGGWQFAADIQGLFLLFKPYCVRPSGFFKTLHDAVILLTLSSNDAHTLLQALQPSPVKPREQTDMAKDKSLIDISRRFGVRKLDPVTIRKVLSCRMLSKT
ncbi:RAD50-interacting protein 1 [Marchantia polymorpha subsp. ruderalis]|uniref:Uncharacterized protein n=2 Tax=Marchantia polymorpha TaxID=3197 RepID=A0AAF6BMW8_MARPO|nr:hypothetical protein MARPO_0035s0069 [Marchantia polymorpha]BBN13352.1 hypothetical protein Mp_6g02820 [Marchantia polymorpha subsp. ruderalis]|eukprot:PTQ41280.1 hypothetical protein MARPO_0035s0069 [Marchantia polymorpha]